MRLTTVQTNFASGELDPTLRGQVDLKAYANGLKRMRNCQRRATGGAERRYGTYDTEGMERSNLIDFEFSDSQRYVFAFSDARLDIFDINGEPLQTITGCPWDGQQAFEITTTQANDVMIVTHQEVQTQQIKRTSATTFALSDFAFEAAIDGNRRWQPYYKFALPEVTLTPSGASGAITLTASAAHFDPLHVGERFRLYDAEVLVTGYTSPTVASATVQGSLEGKLDLDPLKTLAGSTDVEVLHLYHGLETGASVTLSGCNACGFIPGDQIDGTHVVTVIDELRYRITLSGVSYSYDHDGDSTTAPITMTAAATSEDGGGANVRFSVVGSPTRSWLEPAISELRGYPGGSCFHEGRLWLFATPNLPDFCFGSKVALSFNFDVGKGYDGESVQVSSGSEDSSRIWHGVSNGDLQLFTASRESIFVTRDGEAITPNNARVKGQSNAGCSNVQPVVFDGATLFTSENGLAVYELAFSSAENRYRSTAVSTLASHLIRSPQSVCVTKGTTTRSEQLALFVNSQAHPKAALEVPAGSVAVFHSMRAENLAGWGLWTLGAGEVVSACTCGPYIFFCVSVRGTHRLYRMSDDDLGCLDGQVKHEAVGPATTSWVLDARVRNRTVGIRSELGYHGEFAIGADGVLELEVAVSTVVAGDPFYFSIESLPPDIQLASGRQTGEVKRVIYSIIDFEDAYSVTVDGYRVEARQAGDDWAAGVSPVTGPHKITHLGFARDRTVVVSQDEPLPAAVLSWTMGIKL